MSKLFVPGNIKHESYKGFTTNVEEVNGEWIGIAIGLYVDMRGQKKPVQLSARGSHKGVENTRNGIGRELFRLIDKIREHGKQPKMVIN